MSFGLGVEFDRITTNAIRHRLSSAAKVAETVSRPACVEHQLMSPTSSSLQAMHGIKPHSKRQAIKETRLFKYLRAKFKNPVKYTKTGQQVESLVKSGKITEAEYKSFLRSKAAKLAVIEENFDKSSSSYLRWSSIISRKKVISCQDDLMINYYTKYGYDTLNENLRAGKKLPKNLKILRDGLSKALDQATSYKPNLRSRFNSAPHRDQGLYLYRTQAHFSGIEELKPGDTCKFPHFTSTTYNSNPYASNVFSGRYKLIIKPSSKSNGKMIETMSVNSNEQEVLFKPNVKFKIQKITTDSEGKTQIHMEEL